MKRKIQLSDLSVKSFITQMNDSLRKINGGATLAIGCRTNNHLCKPEDTETGDCPLFN